MKYLLILLMLAGCTPTTLKGSGESVPAPYGFIDYCYRHPDRAECGGNK